MNFKEDCLVVLERDSILEKVIQSVAIIIACRSFKMHRKDPWILRISHKNLARYSVSKRRNSQIYLDISSSSFVSPVSDCISLELCIPVNSTAVIDRVEHRLE